MLRKKEQLADGLHLIDFEQLKIENQTLNEKIEERNDELSKLRQKIVTNVIILSHNREKYQFILKQNENQGQKLKLLEDELKKSKEQLADDTNKLKKKQFENVKLSQQTGIVAKPTLSKDFEVREVEKQQLLAAIEELKQKHGNLIMIIEQARMLDQRT